MAASRFSIAQLPVRCEVALTNSNPHIVVEELLTVATEFHVQSGKFFPVIAETQQILVFNGQECTLYSVNDSLVRLR